MDEQLAWSHGALWSMCDQKRVDAQQHKHRVWSLLTALLSVDYVQHTTALKDRRAKNQHITWTDSCSSKPETVYSN